MNEQGATNKGGSQLATATLLMMFAAVDGGAPVSGGKEVMGHVDIGTTMRYLHTTDEGRRGLVEAAVRRGNERPAANLSQRSTRPGDADR